MTDPRLDPAPDGAWTLRYADGAGNAYHLAAVGGGAPTELEYAPVTPATSSSGVYSGGPPRRASLASGDPRLARLWSCVEEALAGGEPSGPRAKGTGALEVVRAGRRDAVVVRGPAQRALEELLAAIDAAATVAAVR